MCVVLISFSEPSEEVAGLTKLLAALVEHSSEWLVAKMAQNDVQALLGLILRLTGWEGTGGVDEQISEVPIFSPCARRRADEIAYITDIPINPGSDHGL